MESMRPSYIDPKTLVRPTAPQQVPTLPLPQQQAQPAAYQQQNQAQLAAAIQQQQAAALQQQQYNAMMQQMAQMQRMGPQQMMPQMGYQQMMPVNYQMPAYLTAPEPLHEGGFWKMFATTVFRSMGKSVGHSVSFMFDSIPLSGTKPPGR
jgi:hypothetical protein